METEIKKLLEQRTAIKKRKPHFLRKDSCSISRLGKGRSKKQKWRKPKGRHSKLRVKKRNVGSMPGVGYRAQKLVRGKIAGLKPVLIKNEKDLEKLHEDEIAVLASLGLKKKIQIAKKASAMHISFLNFDVNKFLAEVQRKIEERKSLGKEMKESSKMK